MIAPAIRLARDGIPLPAEVYYQWVDLTEPGLARFATPDEDAVLYRGAATRRDELGQLVSGDTPTDRQAELKALERALAANPDLVEERRDPAGPRAQRATHRLAQLEHEWVDDRADGGGAASLAADDDGVPGFVVSSGFSFIGPAGIPRPEAEKLNNELAHSIRDPENRKQLIARADEPVGSSIDDTLAWLATPERWDSNAQRGGSDDLMMAVEANLQAIRARLRQPARVEIEDAELQVVTERVPLHRARPGQRVQGHTEAVHPQPAVRPSLVERCTVVGGLEEGSLEA